MENFTIKSYGSQEKKPTIVRVYSTYLSSTEHFHSMKMFCRRQICELL